MEGQTIGLLFLRLEVADLLRIYQGYGSPRAYPGHVSMVRSRQASVSWFPFICPYGVMRRRYGVRYDITPYSYSCILARPFFFLHTP